MSKVLKMVLSLIVVCVPVLVLGQTEGEVAPSAASQVLLWMVEAVVVGALGIAVLIGAYYLWELITPYSVKEQLIQEKNVAVALVVAAFIIGTALVIAAAIAPIK